MRKLLILGASGCVGGALSREFSRDKEFDIFGSSFKNSVMFPMKEVKIDANNPKEAIAAISKVAPDSIVTCLTQRDFERQFIFNQMLIDYIAAHGCRFYFCSTANVFDGDLSRPHYEDDETCSQTSYGKYKIKCEHAIAEKLRETACIFRLPQIWGLRSHHFTRLMASVKDNEPVEAYPGLLYNTNTDEMLAKQIHFIVKENLHGIFHLAADDVVNNKDFVAKLLKRLGCRNVKFSNQENVCENMTLLSRKGEILPSRLHIKNEDVIDYMSDAALS